MSRPVPATIPSCCPGIFLPFSLSLGFRHPGLPTPAGSWCRHSPCVCMASAGSTRLIPYALGLGLWPK